MSAAPAEQAPLIVIAGPTGSGKSSLALSVAEALGAEIISADSMQFYRGLEIGTAAPTPEERRRVPHHFVSFLNPDEEMSAAAYQCAARERAARIRAAGRTAIAAGGSGMYIAALVDGLFDGPGRDPAIRARLTGEAEEQGNAHLLERLRAVDPDYAATLTSENDVVRIVRALEVYELAGRPYSALHREHRRAAESLRAVQFALDYPDRAVLYQRINERVLRMVERGWVEEVEALVAAGYAPQIGRLKALGFREILACLRGEQSLDTAVAATQQHHRRYAKRQLTWFRADPRIHWLPAGPGVSVTEQRDRLLAIVARIGAADDGGAIHRYLQANAGPVKSDA
ncbi:MAG: tRNA (adenosine(37)-N6)-dimethylallyltransferase MiaA [Candidatus Hydrogenedentes bacterium]|nr:tRNA (adenosine(37)-N6)-dimethylallyltransferase MiaA [Candidatus Hydrogenedentota bacterium]